MDEAFIEDAEDHVDDEESEEHEEGEAGKRGGEDLGRADDLTLDAVGNFSLSEFFEFLERGAKGDIIGHVKGDADSGKAINMVDGEGTHIFFDLD